MLDIKVMASGSRGNCYLVGDGKSRLLLDAGISYPRIQEGCQWQAADVDGCLITHVHKDHSLSVNELARRGVKVFGPPSMQEHGLQAMPLKALKKVPLGTFDVTPFEGVHDVECFGYSIKSLETGETMVYLTDSAEVPYVFKNVDYWLIEANHSVEILDRKVAEGLDPTRANRTIATHMGLEKLEKYFSGLDCSMAKEIYLIHLSDDNSDAEEFKHRIQRVTGAAVTVA